MLQYNLFEKYGPCRTVKLHTDTITYSCSPHWHCHLQSLHWHCQLQSQSTLTLSPTVTVHTDTVTYSHSPHWHCHLQSRSTLTLSPTVTVHTDTVTYSHSPHWHCETCTWLWRLIECQPSHVPRTTRDLNLCSIVTRRKQKEKKIKA